MIDPCPLETVEPFQAEAHEFRRPGTRRDDLALIVLGRLEVNGRALGC